MNAESKADMYMSIGVVFLAVGIFLPIAHGRINQAAVFVAIGIATVLVGVFCLGLLAKGAKHALAPFVVSVAVGTAVQLSLFFGQRPVEVSFEWKYMCSLISAGVAAAVAVSVWSVLSLLERREEEERFSVATNCRCRDRRDRRNDSREE